MFSLYTFTDSLVSLENIKANFSNNSDVQKAVCDLQASIAVSLANALQGKDANPNNFTNEELMMFRNRQYKHNKIQIIKKVRERSGCGLREAKEAVEKYATDCGYEKTWTGGYEPTDYGYQETPQF
jgi:ribosomal protein L7/L12